MTFALPLPGRISVFGNGGWAAIPEGLGRLAGGNTPGRMSMNVARPGRGAGAMERLLGPLVSIAPAGATLLRFATGDVIPG